jgi:hypothetical protein
MWELGFNTITDIDGVDSNTVAVVGDGGVRGAIGLYRNGKWDTLSVPNLRPSMHSVDIVSAYEIYIASVDGILKIDGDTYKWIVDSSASKYLPGSGYPFNPGDVIKGVDGKIYYTEYSELPGNPPALKMFMIDDDGVVEKISVVEYPTNDNVRVGFYMNIVGDMLLSGQSSIYSLYAGVATHEHDVAGVRFTGDDPRRNLYSVGKKSIWHYNGVDWANVTPEEVASSARMFPIRDAYFVDDVLFVCVTHDGYKTLIYRGYQQ